MKTACAVLGALVLHVSAVPAADDYVVRLSRPAKVGDHYRLDARGTKREQERVTIGGQVQKKSNEYSVHLVALATVLAVDSRSDATRTEYLVESCRKTSSGRTEDVLPAGRKIVADSGGRGETVFTVDGDPVLEDISKALKVVITAHAPDSPADDEIFGTSDRKRVGDRWNINSATAAKDLSRTGLAVAADDLSGTVSLDGVRAVDAVQVLEITAQFRAERMTVDLPDWLQLEKSSMSAEMAALVPVDPEIPNVVSTGLKMQIRIVFRGQKPETGSPVTIDETMEMSVEKRYSPLRRTETAGPEGDTQHPPRPM
jgi:hypothetical protein